MRERESESVYVCVCALVLRLGLTVQSKLALTLHFWSSSSGMWDHRHTATQPAFLILLAMYPCAVSWNRTRFIVYTRQTHFCSATSPAVFGLFVRRISCFSCICWILYLNTLCPSFLNWTAWNRQNCQVFNIVSSCTSLPLPGEVY